MAEINKPDYTFLWSSGGAIVPPSNAKIQAGWTAEVPPFQWENWSQNRQDQGIAHILQHGISTWDSVTEYQAGKSYVQGSDGFIYKAIQTTTNQNPTTDLSFTYWTKSNTGGLINVRTFTTNGSYTPTAGTNFIVVEVQAAGGGGGGVAATSFGVAAGGSGGGAGGYGVSRIASGFSGASIVVGLGGAGSAGDGGNGGATSFGAFISTTGGSGGSSSPGTATFPVQQAGADGGIASGGNIYSSRGADGAAAVLMGPTNSIAGAGGQTKFNPGGSRRIGASGAGIAGQYGSGGGGAISQNSVGASGGPGGDGIVIIWEYN